MTQLPEAIPGTQLHTNLRVLPRLPDPTVVSQAKPPKAQVAGKGLRLQTLQTPCPCA